MLLVISSATSQYDGSAWAPPKRANRKRKLSKGTGTRRKRALYPKPKTGSDAAAQEAALVPAAEDGGDPRWGQTLPEELLISIFQMVVVQDGPVPFLCR